MTPNDLHESCDTGLSGAFNEERADVVPHGRTEVTPLTEFGGRHDEPPNANGAEIAEHPAKNNWTGVPKKQVHREQVWQAGRIRRSRGAIRRGSLVGLKAERHSGFVQRIDDGGSDRPIHDTCAQTVTDPELQDLANVSHAIVIRRETDLIFFKEEDVQFLRLRVRRDRTGEFSLVVGEESADLS